MAKNTDHIISMLVLVLDEAANAEKAGLVEAKRVWHPKYDFNTLKQIGSIEALIYNLSKQEFRDTLFYMEITQKCKTFNSLIFLETHLKKDIF